MWAALAKATRGAKVKGRKRPVRKKISINLSKELEQAIIRFTETKTAHRLGIYSKDRCVESVMIAFLLKYYDGYKAMEGLFVLEEDRIKNADKSQLTTENDKETAS